MKFSTLSTLATLTGLGAAIPMKRQAPSSSSSASSAPPPSQPPPPPSSQPPPPPPSSMPPMAAAGAANMGNQDVTILQFALTLEHLENVFYKQALQKFSAQDFKNAGFDDDVLTNLKFLVEDEQSHVQLLTQAIQQAGQTPVQACTYNFPITDVQSFMTLSATLEGIGTSAYLGAAGLIQDKKILGTAGAILSVEALHTSQQRQALAEVPAANALYTPVDANSIFTLASAFIKECPPNNPPLPFKAFPTLTGPPAGCASQGGQMMGQQQMQPPPSSPKRSRRVRRGQQVQKGEVNLTPPHPNEIAEDTMPNAPDAIATLADGAEAQEGGQLKGVGEVVAICAPPVAGENIQFQAQGQIPQGAMLTFVSGLDVTSVPAQMNGQAMQAQIPGTAKGQVYVFATKSAQQGMIADDQVLAGPAVIEVGPPPPNIDQKIL